MESLSWMICTKFCASNGRIHELLGYAVASVFKQAETGTSTTLVTNRNRRLSSNSSTSFYCLSETENSCYMKNVPSVATRTSIWNTHKSSRYCSSLYTSSIYPKCLCSYLMSLRRYWFICLDLVQKQQSALHSQSLYQRIFES